MYWELNYWIKLQLLCWPFSLYPYLFKKGRLIYGVGEMGRKNWKYTSSSQKAFNPQHTWFLLLPYEVRAGEGLGRSTLLNGQVQIQWLNWINCKSALLVFFQSCSSVTDSRINFKVELKAKLWTQFCFDLWHGHKSSYRSFNSSLMWTIYLVLGVLWYRKKKCQIRVELNVNINCHKI